MYVQLKSDFSGDYIVRQFSHHYSLGTVHDIFVDSIRRLRSLSLDVVSLHLKEAE